MKKKYSEIQRPISDEENTQPTSCFNHIASNLATTSKKQRKTVSLRDITNVHVNLESRFEGTLENVPKPVCQRKSARWRGLDNIDTSIPPRRIRKQTKDVSFDEQQTNVKENLEVNKTAYYNRYSRTSKPPRMNRKQKTYLPAATNFSRNQWGQCQIFDSTVVPQEEHYRNVDFNVECEPLTYCESEFETESESEVPLLPNIGHTRGMTVRRKKTIAEVVYIDEGDPIHECKFCHARMWFNERVKKDRNQRNVDVFSMCCLKGKVVLPPFKEPPPLFRKLFLNKETLDSKNFYENIRQYNNMFSFTSMGGKINHSMNNGAGPYSFVLSGMNYHHIGNLIPPEGARPVFSQLYIHDTENEVSNRISAVSNQQKDSSINPMIVDQIKKQLDQVNPFVKQFRIAAQMLAVTEKPSLKMVLLGNRQHDGRTYNLPSASEVAALIVGDIDREFHVRDIVIETISGSLQRINELHTSYLPLQYPLLFPYGEDGYRDDIMHREETLVVTKTRKRVSIREFVSYKLMIRFNEVSTLLHASRLLQQFIVDTYTMLESQRLLWIRTHQKELRADLYKGLADAVINGETDASSTGKRIVLPSSFTGGARYMMGNYQDAMAICRTIGYPDLFITFTCNPAWPEVTRLCNELKINPSDCPQVLSRVFYMKLRSLMKVLKEDQIFGKVRAEIYTIEFQKRGLPHAHILIFLDHKDKISDPEAIDNIISAEIPNKEVDPELHELVRKFMLHGPCGVDNPKARCMKDKKCSKYFPKKLNNMTTIDDDGYPTYRRRDDRRTIELKGVPLDNRFVVPYNPFLLKMFNAHINIEKCNQSTAIKYLFKYISKGNDRVVVGLFDNGQNGSGNAVIDEVQQYLNCRYVSACEASWRVFGFPIHHRYPSVERLSFHLPNQQYIIYSSNEKLSNLLDKPRVCESQFLSWMEMNEADTFAATLTYSEFPNHYVYQKGKRSWKLREKGFSVGRMAHVSPSAGELYYLRILLTKVRGPKSYDEIKQVDGVVHETFKDACFARGLLDDDREFVTAIKEASTWASGHCLRKLFVTMLLCGSLHRPHVVWEATAGLLSEDMLHISRNETAHSGISFTAHEKEQAALRKIDNLLRLNGKTLHDYSPMPIPEDIDDFDLSNHLILQELRYDKEALKLQSKELIASLNCDQLKAFSEVMDSVQSRRGGFFFVYGFGGTGKTFLWSALASSIRANGNIVLTVASSGIAATLLPGGRTAHSRFAIPIQINEFSVCSILQNSPLANLIRRTSLIIWDEAAMVQRFCVEAFNRSLQDVMHSNLPFGGKCIVMGGDFRQILPIIPKGSRPTIVDACINSSHLWNGCKIFHLTKNMRLNSSNEPVENQKIESFSRWLLDVGDGKIGTLGDGFCDLEIPKELLVDCGDDPVNAIVESTYDRLFESLTCNSYFNDRAILAPTIEMVNQINDHMCSILPGDAQEFLSCDTICKTSTDSDSIDNLYTTEFLNTISCSGMAPHKLLLKVGVPIMLLRNIDQEAGLCNGTRLIVSKIGKMVIEAKTLNGSRPNQKVLIHRMDMNPSESRWPFRMQRRQFPITLSFAMTINKSQGQSLKKVGLYLSKPVFTHGQLYVALSRVRSMEGLKIVLSADQQEQGNKTKNVVYEEVFMNVAVN